MAAVPAISTNEYADGQLQLRLESIPAMQMEQKRHTTGTIARFAWELGVLKHNILNEENSPKAHLIVYLNCTERSQRLDGWSCRARIKLTLESASNSKGYPFEHIRFPMIETSTPGSGVVIVLPWDKLLSEFQLNEGQDWLNVAAKVSIIEQVGYGSLIQLNTRLAVHGNVLLVNKYHLATYSTYFQAFFFSEWAKDKVEYELNDPDDDIDALQLMLAMAYPVDNYPQPTNNKIDEILRLSDKYDLQIVSERCERYLMDDGDTNGASSSNKDLSEKPLLQRLVLAERYGLFNLKSYCLERISPTHFCINLRDNIAVYNELSDGLKVELEERLARKSAEEFHHGQPRESQMQHQQQQHQNEGALPPPHKRVRPRPKTPPRPNYNLPPFRFK